MLPDFFLTKLLQPEDDCTDETGGFINAGMDRAAYAGYAIAGGL